MTEREKTPDCNMREALVSYLYSEATSEEARAVEAHIKECATCSGEIAGFNRVRGMLQHWQLEDMPMMKIVAGPQKRAFLAAMKELLAAAPLWAKLATASAMILVVLAVLGTEVSIDRDGFSLRADLLRSRSQSEVRSAPTDAPGHVAVEQVRADMVALVGKMIAESERQQKDEFRAQLVSLQSEIQNLHATELARIASRVERQRTRLQTLERDIDRREGMDLTEILFSEVMNQTERVQERSRQGGD
jgi:hypothetical protein